jgi:hypothetical protein
MAKTDLTAERLRELLHYDPETGVFTRLSCPYRRDREGQVAGSKRLDGYWAIVIKGDVHFGHRLAWLYTFGVWPTKQVDHINGVRDDNRLNNLREATNAENQQNRKTNVGQDESSRGTRHRKNGRWAAVINVNGQRKSLGYYGTQEEARKAYVTAKEKLHTFCPVAYS